MVEHLQAKYTWRRALGNISNSLNRTRGKQEESLVVIRCISINFQVAFDFPAF